ncbi:MAG: helix-turn-helix transcriptional regulator [Pseudomonadota bacterium]
MELEKIGLLIRDARRARKLSQEDLGRPLGMSRATISGIETGRINEVGVRKLMAVCASLGLELLAAPRRKYPTLQELREQNHAKNRG